MRGRRHSAAGLRAALDEAQLRSLQNQRALREAGERGQRLLREEASLREQLGECRCELQALCWRAGRGEPEAEEPLEDGAGAAGRGSAASPTLAGLLARARREQAIMAQAEKRRLRRHNMLLAEELEEQERELARFSPQRHGGSSLEAERLSTSELVAEIAEASAFAARADEARGREHETFSHKLSEVQEQAFNMLTAIDRQLETVRGRNMLLCSELQCERRMRVECVANRQEVIESLHQELAELQRGSATTERELLQMQRRLSSQQAGQARSAAADTSPLGATSLPVLGPEMELLVSEWRSAAEAPCEGPEPSTPEPTADGPRRLSLSSAASETWDGLAVFEASAPLLGSAGSQRRRLRARGTHCYRTSSDVLVLRALDPRDEAPPSWSAALGGLVDDALLSVDGLMRAGDT
mmetsp:Transcript_97020/g.313289  ORF Transcript_97020/g.313289 Transcript_97020/m.313289 type:complete len:413 (-) Transcript_97020:57-1295(-)